MQPELSADLRRVLVARLDNVGDVILTGPLFRHLRGALPEATLGLLASPGGANAAALLPWVDEVQAWQPVWQDLGQRMPLQPAREQALIEMLRAGRWDAVLIATSWNQTAWPAAYATYLAGIPVRVAFARDFGGSVLSHPVTPPGNETHQAERNLALLAPFRIPVGDTALEIAVPADARAHVRDRLAAHGLEAGDSITVVPGASAPARRLSPERFGLAAARLAARTGRPVVIAGTPRERPLLDAVLDVMPGAISIGDDLSLPEYAALVEAAALVLCGNSSALHLADALHRPVIAAYGGTDLRSQWRPRSSDAELLSVAVACSPCYLIDCPIGNACLRLDPGEIAARGEALLARADRPTAASRAAGARVGA